MAFSKDTEFTYEIIKDIGQINEGYGDWSTEIKLVSMNGRAAKFDIRTWLNGDERMGKGISLSEEDMDKLVELYQEYKASK